MFLKTASFRRCKSFAALGTNNGNLQLPLALGNETTAIYNCHRKAICPSLPILTSLYKVVLAGGRWATIKEDWKNNNKIEFANLTSQRT